MKTVEVSHEKLMDAYCKANPEERAYLESLFDRKCFYPNILDRVRTIHDACHELGLDLSKELHGLSAYKAAERRIELFARALREGRPESECLYYPSFEISSNKFSFYVADSIKNFLYIGARLRVDTPKKAEYLGRCMINDYSLYILG